MNRPMTLGDAIVALDELAAERSTNAGERQLMTAVMAIVVVNGSKGRVRVDD